MRAHLRYPYQGLLKRPLQIQIIKKEKEKKKESIHPVILFSHKESAGLKPPFLRINFFFFKVAYLQKAQIGNNSWWSGKHTTTI